MKDKTVPVQSGCTSPVFSVGSTCKLATTKKSNKKSGT
jgi:hypothetical protein